MYKNIEEVYKLKNPYNKVRLAISIIYGVFIIISLVFNYFKLLYLSIPVLIILPIVMYKVLDKILKAKLHFDISGLFKNENGLDKIVDEEEHNMFKEYVIEHGWYNEKSLFCILEHYRNLCNKQNLGDELIQIASIIIPSIISIFISRGFNINSIVYIITFILLIAMLYYLYKKVLATKKFLKGEDGMYERLEIIFSELYVECINSTEKALLIEFTNDDMSKFEEKLWPLLTSKHIFMYNTETAIRELFDYLMSKVWTDKFYHTDDHLCATFCAIIGNRKINVQLDYKLQRFLEVNNINILKLDYTYSGRGAGTNLEEIGSVRINFEEGEHKNSPHVHIYQGKFRDKEHCIRFFLDEDIPIFEKDQKKYTKLFTKSQRKQIEKFLEENYKQLREYYESVQNGESPKPKIIYFDGKKLLFK